MERALRAGPLATLEVPADRLRRQLDPGALPFQSTQEVAPLDGTVGQPRAVEALQFGIAMRKDGFNVFVTGLPGSGRLSTVEDLLRRAAEERPAPADWIYVQNFSHPDQPAAIALRPGAGDRVGRALEAFIAEARRRLSRAFESQEYQRRRTVVEQEIEQRLDSVRKEMEAIAFAEAFLLQVTPAGAMLIPMRRGRALTPAEIHDASPREREEVEQRATALRRKLDAEMPRLHQAEREGMEQLAAVEREFARDIVRPLLDTLRQEFAGEEALLRHLDAIADDLPAQLEQLRERAEPGPAGAIQASLGGGDGRLDRYRVNVLVDNGALEHAPVVVERNPTYYNLFGRVEYHATFGAMVTDFLHVRAGALHRANGGFLVLEADALLGQPFAWEGLKRALQTRSIKIENLSEQLSPVPTASLHPDAIPLDVRVILIGSPLLYRLLGQADEDLREHFKVRADFAPDMPWDDANIAAYAAFIRRVVDDRGLRHFSSGGVARVIEHGSRLREDQRKLSTRLAEIADLVSESSFWAERNGKACVDAGDVDRAVESKSARSSLGEERAREYIERRIIRIETDASAVGQVNGLAVIDFGDHSFGLPTRITATAALGRGGISSIEREIEASGPTHSKGVLILSGYLADQYGRDVPLPLQISITFEQSYDEVEGDSASSTELYAILSALSGAPIRQGIAVTGSVDQRGDVQAIGGVVEKIEGFYKVCASRGLTGEQGVLIPASNIDNLMLSRDVVDACRAARFHVWAVHDVDQGIEVLTGIPAGARAADGSYPAGSIHHRIAERIRSDAERLRDFSAEGTVARDGHNSRQKSVAAGSFGPGTAMRHTRC